MVAVFRLVVLFTWLTYSATETIQAMNDESICLLHNRSTGYSTICFSPLQINCVDGEHIFIKDVSYFKAKNQGSCQSCNGLYDQWQVYLVEFEGILCELCHGMNNCFFNARVPITNGQVTDNRMVWLSKVEYDCIEKDMYRRGIQRQVCNQTQNRTETDTTPAFKSSTKAELTTREQTQTSSLMEHSVTRCTSGEDSTSTNYAFTQNNNKQTSDPEVSLSVIIGGTAGGLAILVIVIIISCFAFKCRRRISRKAQDAYSKADFKTKTKTSSNVMVGVHNLLYENKSLRNNKGFQQTKEDASIQTYDEPIDTVFKAGDLQSRTCQEENCLYEETCDVCVIPGGRPSVNCETVMKLAKARDKPKGDFSHIQDQINLNVMVKKEDNYSHTNPFTLDKMLEHPMENQYSHIDEFDRIKFANTNNEYSHIVLSSLRNEIKKEQCYDDEDQYNHI